MEPIHVARLFDISTGMGAKLESAAKIVQARSLDILKKAKDNFRSIIDENTPSFYLIDIRNDIINVIKPDYPDISIDRLYQELQAALEAVAFETSYSDFKATIDLAYKTAETSLNALATKTSPSHLQYRDIFRTLGQDITKAFRSLDRKDQRSITRISDPASMGYPNKLVFVGKSFKLAQKNINAAINTTIAKHLNLTSFSYGKYMNAGHTAVKLSSTQYGTNTPATQEALFKLEMASKDSGTSFDKFKFQDDFVKKVPLFLEYSVDMYKDFSFARTLIDLNFTFVVPMPASANAASGTTEFNAIKELTSNTIMPGLAEAMKARLSWLKDVAVNLRSSLSLKDFVLEIVKEGVTKGTSSTKLKQDWSKSKKIKLTDVVVPKLKKASPSPKAAKAIGTSTPVKASESNLSSLLVILNSQLQDVISANMGDGSSRNVLNYRTGRLASSAKVTRLTQSREGMVTAYYSYMKNPYATFSEGGVQQYPRTRDPKLLISRSIREILAEQAVTKLRAVNI
jgi:hypothetical protein